MQRVTAQFGFSHETSLKKPNAFTLVELLIVVSIIAIMTASLIPSFAGYIKGQGLKQALEQVKSDLRSTQNRALTGALSDQMVGSNPVKYWGVRFSHGSALYSYFVTDSNTTCPNSIPAAQAQGTSQLTDDLQLKFSSAGYRCLFFDMSSGSINAVPALPNNEIILGKVGGNASGDCRRLIFTTNGLLYNSPSILCT